MDKFSYNGALELEAMKKFGTDAINGKLKQNYKSKPETSLVGPVYELVGSNFRDFVNVEKDAIVHYYVPECNFCDEFRPIFDQVAKEYAENDVQLSFVSIENRNNDSGF